MATHEPRAAQSEPRDSRESGEWTPRPDPTALTTAQLQRELGALKELITTRLDGMEKALDLFRENMTRVPTEVDKAVSHLKELHEEKFRSVERRFVEHNVRMDSTKEESKEAVAAALSAVKALNDEHNSSTALAVAKNEMAVDKQIGQLQTLMNTSSQSNAEKIDEIKQRLNRGEGQSKGHSELLGWIFGAAGMVCAIIVTIMSLRR